MTRVKKRVISALLAGFVLLNAMAFMHARAMTRFVTSGTRTPFPEQLTLAQKLGVLFTGVTVPRPQNQRTPQSVGLASIAETFTTTDGQRLGAWRIPAKDPRALVVMHHGYAGAKADLLDESVLLNRMGAETLLVDFRGSGDSSGGSAGSRFARGVDEALDVAAVFRAVRAERPARGRRPRCDTRCADPGGAVRPARVHHRKQVHRDWAPGLPVRSPAGPLNSDDALTLNKIGVSSRQASSRTPATSCTRRITRTSGPTRSPRCSRASRTRRLFGIVCSP